MSDENKNNNDMAEVARSIGQLSGKLEIMHSSITDNFNVLRADMRRMEDSTKQSMEHLENRLNTKVDSLGTRVKVLEVAEKGNIKTMAIHGVTIAGISTALTLGAVELLKHLK
jgi:hypothetical protein